ncbi:MAG: transglycosylase SLT domain-containing protein [Acidobacteria bacterium]|nr:transglycosylase SLT domain-containing protein [Acidobacteriota bacterium]
MKSLKFLPIILILAGCLFLVDCARNETAVRTVPPPPGKAAAVPEAPPSEKAAPAPVEEATGKTISPVEEKNLASGVLPVNGQAADDASITIEDVLELYAEAKAARERGDFEGAVAYLDEAYAALLRLRIPADSPLIQDKDNLRLLIAQRIQEISAARRNPAVENHKSIPLIENEWVLREIRSFTGPERTAFLEGYRRSGFYKDWIVDELQKAGLPSDLVWLPIVESMYKPLALSSARALGIWQFIRTTGLNYGLNQDKFIDERRDPYKSTFAAIKYLEHLHSFFGDWTTALAAYNCGEGYVQRIINSQNISYLDNFWDLFQRLPYQTARYVPRFIAVVLIIRDPEKYGVSLPAPYPPLRFDTVRIQHPAKLSVLAAAMGLDSSELEFLNPELRYQSTPDTPYDLRVPVGMEERLLAALPALPKYIPPEYGTHKVRSGETLSTIARRYGTSVQNLQKINGIRGTLIRAGQVLRIPSRG